MTYSSNINVGLGSFKFRVVDSGVLGRLLMVFPADLFARLLGAEAVEGLPEPGSLQMWLQQPPPEGAYLRLFVLATWHGASTSGWRTIVT